MFKGLIVRRSLLDPPPPRNYVKGAVNVISSEPPSKDGNARFTTVPLKTLSDPYRERCIVVFICLKLFNSDNVFLQYKCASHCCSETTIEKTINKINKKMFN